MPDEKLRNDETGHEYDKPGLAAKARAHDPKYQQMSDDDIWKEFSSYSNWKPAGSAVAGASPATPATAPPPKAPVMTAPQRQPSAAQSVSASGVKILSSGNRVNDDVLMAQAMQIASGNRSAQDVIRQFPDKIQQNKLWGHLATIAGPEAYPLDKTQVDFIGGSNRLFSELIPALEEMMQYLPNEKNQKFQWAQGKLQNKFTNPDLARMQARLNAAATQIGQGLYNESRMTDADALRVYAGVSLDPSLPLDFNQKTIDYLKQKGKLTLQENLRGIPKRQLDYIVKHPSRKAIASLLAYGETPVEAPQPNGQPTAAPASGAYPSFEELRQRRKAGSQPAAGQPAPPQAKKKLSDY